MNTQLFAPILTSTCCVLAFSAQAQIPRPPQLQSPVVHSDRTVTFSFRAPNAKKVELSTQFIKGNQPLKTNESGLWTITLGPVEPNLYPYSFIVDGVSVADPNNPNIFPNERFKSSLVDIPGEQPAIYSIQDVPHGEVTHCYYRSRTLGATRPLAIYTPPGYRQGTKKYPVLYLVSGATHPGSRLLYWKGPRQASAVSDDHWKLIVTAKTVALYNLTEDIGEKNDLAAKNPDPVRQLRAKLETQSAKDNDAVPNRKVTP